jgi:hypothetical protein
MGLSVVPVAAAADDDELDLFGDDEDESPKAAVALTDST